LICAPPPYLHSWRPGVAAGRRHRRRSSRDRRPSAGAHGRDHRDTADLVADTVRSLPTDYRPQLVRKLGPTRSHWFGRSRWLPFCQSPDHHHDAARKRDSQPLETCMTQRLFRFTLATALAACAAILGVAASEPAAAAPADLRSSRRPLLTRHPGRRCVSAALLRWLAEPVRAQRGLRSGEPLPAGGSRSLPGDDASPRCGATTAALLSWTLDAKGGQAYTIAGVGTGRHGRCGAARRSSPSRRPVPAGCGRSGREPSA